MKGSVAPLIHTRGRYWLRYSEKGFRRLPRRGWGWERRGLLALGKPLCFGWRAFSPFCKRDFNLLNGLAIQY